MTFIIFFFLYILQSVAIPLQLSSPLDDDFYTLPQGYEAAAPGDILKIRPAPAQLSSLFIPVNVKNVWQLVVRSEDSFGQPTAFITTIIEPFNADPSKVVSYQTMEDSASLNCSPSYGLQSGSPISTIATQYDMTFMVTALDQGYYVASPDYEGFISAFTVGRRSGQAVLDSVRAVINSGNFTGINNDAKVGLWGYSGGALASGWAAALQPSYAPELKSTLVGASLGGFVTNITAVAEIVDGELFAGLIPVALTGISNEYPQAKVLVQENVAPQHLAKFNEAGNKCLIPSIFYFFFDHILTGTDPMIPAGFSLLANGQVKSIIESNSLVYLNSSYVPEIPIFVYHGTLDMVVPIKDVYVTYDNWCNWGIGSFEFAEDLLNGHLSEQLVGGPAAWTWLDRLLQGGKPINGCSHTSRVSNLLYPGISAATKDYFEGIKDSLLDMQLGPEAKNMTMKDIFNKY
ncbi:secretory lipase 1 [Spathaspora passalidarum NRRL Y-27907]|uniref:Secretory lipase 1 n=1 Tax=Spathaspora passalidarum (strain NRRL Y-27907 / 11-Y1) TaxID=619300 RepID=G3AQV5_SPAPN|nr:secretory lipase 1 [Spathaspora passalidarum NRRL Y-27907]EGW31184.1 secretory lipase 1 [Spathaspora passalidarum NRRL Y-27907]